MILIKKYHKYSTTTTNTTANLARFHATVGAFVKFLAESKMNEIGDIVRSA